MQMFYVLLMCWIEKTDKHMRKIEMPILLGFTYVWFGCRMYKYMPTYQTIKHNICSHLSYVRFPTHQVTHEVTHENKYTQNTTSKTCAKSKLLFTTFQDLF